MSQDNPQEPASAPPAADVDPGHDLSTPAGYLAELSRMRLQALADGEHSVARGYMDMIGKVHRHYAEPEPEPDAEVEHDKELIRKLAIRLGLITEEDGKAT